MARKTIVRHARNFYSTRALPIDLAVIHCTQSPNPSADGVSNYFARNEEAGSTQWVFDDVLSVRCVWDHETCWGAKGHNSNGLHYEFCGYAEWSREEWLQHMETIKAAAAQIAADMKKYRIPFREAQVVGGRARNGYHTHNGLPGNDHTDPAPGRTGRGAFPMDVLFAEIKKGLGIVHAVATSKPVISARDVKRRNNLTVVIDRRDGSRQIGQGWRSKKAGGGAQGMLAWLADFENPSKKLNPATVVTLIWQGVVFSSADPRYGQDGVRKVARSILSRYGS